MNQVLKSRKIFLLNLFFLAHLPGALAYDVTGILQGKSEIIVKTKASGEIVQVLFEEGKMVKEGDTLAVLDNSKEILEEKMAKLDWDSAKQDYEKTLQLKKFVSQEELQLKKENFLKKEALYELKKINLENKKILSPLEGLISQQFIKVKESIAQGEKAFEIIQLQELVIELDIIAERAKDLKLNQTLNFSTELHPNQTFKGTISFISPVLEKTTGTIKVKLSLPNREIGPNLFFFKPGTLVTVKI